MDTSSIKYGPGVTQEVGWDMEEQGARRVMVVTDLNMAESEAVSAALESLQKYNKQRPPCPSIALPSSRHGRLAQKI